MDKKVIKLIEENLAAATEEVGKLFGDQDDRRTEMLESFEHKHGVKRAAAIAACNAVFKQNMTVVLAMSKFMPSPIAEELAKNMGELQTRLFATIIKLAFDDVADKDARLVQMEDAAKFLDTLTKEEDRVMELANAKGREIEKKISDALRRELGDGDHNGNPGGLH